MGYLEDYRRTIRNLHDQTGQSCHWTLADDAAFGVQGPCDCPSPSGASPCQHQGHLKGGEGHGCSKTDTVLGMHSALTNARETVLGMLEQHVPSLGEVLRIGNNLRDPALVWDETTMSNQMDVHFASTNQQILGAVDLIIALPAVPLYTPPSWAFSETCICAVHKMMRVHETSLRIEALSERAGQMASRLGAMWSTIDPRLSIQPGFWDIARVAAEAAGMVSTAFGPGLIGVAGTALGLGTAIFGTPPAGQLGPNVTRHLFVWEVFQLAKLKALLLLEANYLEQMCLAPTCITPDFGRSKKPGEPREDPGPSPRQHSG